MSSASTATTDLAPFHAVGSEPALVQLAIALGAATVGGPLSHAETALLANALPARPEAGLVRLAKEAIQAGEDPLGVAFYTLRSSLSRRQAGAVYTPGEMVRPMVNWTMTHKPERLIDAGSGSGRFSVAAARLAPNAHIVAVDLDPLATLMTRAAMAVIGHERVTVLHQDFTRLQLSPVGGVTAFIGNPPYVRHHNLTPATKAWAQKAASLAGHSMSGLAGLHAYFYLACALLGRVGDIGCFVTSSEWLDVNYGAIVRELLLDGLGGLSMHVIEPEALPFQATTTAAVTCFRVGDQPTSLRLRSVKRVDDLDPLQRGRPIARARLLEATRWSPFFRIRQAIPDGHVELGELCRVHRGAVTGDNSTWVRFREGLDLPEDVLFPAVTKARELFAAGEEIVRLSGLRVVVDLPHDLDQFDAGDRKRIDRFLRKAKSAGAHAGYIATHRRAWWAVGLREPAPILATYMARRPPAFVRNAANARHINVAHGLYPRGDIPARALKRLSDALRASVTVGQGRTYAGGLTKFEPKEMERLLVPDLPTLLAP